jgi:hypothetical protein
MTIRRSCIPANLEGLFLESKDERVVVCIRLEEALPSRNRECQIINHARVLRIRMWVGFLVVSSARDRSLPCSRAVDDTQILRRPSRRWKVEARCGGSGELAVKRTWLWYLNVFAALTAIGKDHNIKVNNHLNRC